MKNFRLAFVLVAAWTQAVAQTSAPGTCFSFNTANMPQSSLPLMAAGDLHLGITAPITTTIEQIDVRVSGPITPVLTVQVFSWTGTAIGPLLGTGFSLPPNANAVSALILTSPVPVTAGSIYVLRLTVAASFTYIHGDLAQTTPIPYLLTCGPLAGGPFPPCNFVPATGTHGTWLKLRAAACGQTPNATATQIGAGCGSFPTFNPPILWTPDPPVLGTNFPTIVSGYFGATGVVHLFVAAGPATSGLNLGLGSGCTSYLDPLTTQLLVTFPGVAITNTTTIAIPLDPTLAGVTVTAQALVQASAGVPSPIGPIQISNALELFLGY